jgi:hypothetical protein
MYKKLVACNIISKLINSIQQQGILFQLLYNLSHRGRILADVVDGIWFCSSCCPNTSPMVVSEAYVEIWNGKVQSGPHRIGASDKHVFFRHVKSFWHLSVHINSMSFESSENIGMQA